MTTVTSACNRRISEVRKKRGLPAAQLHHSFPTIVWEMRKSASLCGVYCLLNSFRRLEKFVNDPAGLFHNLNGWLHENTWNGRMVWWANGIIFFREALNSSNSSNRLKRSCQEFCISSAFLLIARHMGMMMPLWSVYFTSTHKGKTKWRMYPHAINTFLLILKGPLLKQNRVLILRPFLCRDVSEGTKKSLVLAWVVIISLL